MSLDLPPMIAALNRAPNDRAAAAFADCFTTDGVVEDQPEEVVIEGRAALKNWATEIARFHLLVEPGTLQSGTEESLLTCRTSGDFPGSPLLLAYHFHLTGGRIPRLVLHLSSLPCPAAGSVLALRLLVLHGMSITLDVIIHYEERLRREIAERECLLGVLKVMHTYAASGHGLKSLELGSLVSALSPSEVSLHDAPGALPAAPASLPAPAPEPPYLHPELCAIPVRLRTDTRVVAWATQHMTADYTLRDIAALLDREGARLRHEKISVVLTRLKNRGEIHEMQRGRGRTATIFRQPLSTTPSCEVPTDTPIGTPSLAQ